jgi:thermostable 8-oxoguanine DNA glycosylase
MIDVLNVTNYNRTEEELEEFLLFSVLVAGKKSDVTAKKLSLFLDSAQSYGYSGFEPFKYISFLVQTGQLDSLLREFKIGQYRRFNNTFTELANLRGRLSKISVKKLEQITGIGPKTARFFCLHSRKNVKLAVLDTHILKFLRDSGYTAPITTPSGEKYRYWEQVFLGLCESIDKAPANYDLEIWTKYSKKQKLN